MAVGDAVGFGIRGPQGLGYGLWRLGLRVIRVSGLRYGVSRLGFSLGLRVQGLRYGLSRLGVRLEAWGFPFRAQS